MNGQAQIAVVGLGATGLACACFLAGRGRRVAVTDSRSEPPQLAALKAAYPDVPVSAGALDAELLLNAGEIVVSPGVSLEEPELRRAAEAGATLISEIELFCRYAQAPIVAITGSNGKSTVTTLLGEMARAAGIDAAVGGNLGRPALELLSDPEPAFYALELSSFQLESTYSLQARAAVVLNVSADHMDRYPTLQAYAAAKGVVYAHAGTAVVNRDDPVAQALVPETAGRVVSFGQSPAPGEDDYGLATDGDGRSWLTRGTRRLIGTAALRLMGRHNHANVLAAIALAEAMGIPQAAVLEACKVFPGLAHRTEWVGRHYGVDYINDSKATNVGATQAAVSGLPGPVILIAGGQGKGADFSPLAETLVGRVRAVILFGQDAGQLTSAIVDRVTVERVVDLEAAVRRAFELARPGEQVLLSPACASFDMFTGFEARGDAFREAVGRLGHG